ncbi:9679_t:CDS:2 [Gigaspora margarita]|uniref:9679_t:CDS:1 n=1 Tax=Gigaspora margarita TaxID=4874 RepID=A0ABN7U930_GIGMA|nr:9679_t:CDS:2 [Gigaspora margarita]
MSINDSSSSNPLESTSAKRKADKAKRGKPRMPIWDDYIEDKDDGHGHFEASCCYCNKGKWQHEKPSTMEAHLALHCKGLVLDDIRRRWLIEVAKRDALSGLLLDGEIAGDSLYVFIITTPNLHEYLYALADYSEEYQTGNFIANKILDIIENIAPNLVKAISIKKILKKANILIAFFQKSHLASKLLRDTISSMNIKGESLETYSKICWVSIYNTTNSIIRIKPAIDKVYKLINEDDTFYISYKRISLIFELIKRVINLLESHMANLANCFIGIVQIAVALKKISASNNFRTLAIAVFNFRYQQFDISSYLLTYYFHPNYRNKGLKNGKFLEIAVEDKNSDLQELAKTMFAIFTEGRRTWLQVPQLESMAQLHSFYISNVEKKLKLNNFVKMELHNNLTTNDITTALQDLVDLSDPIFGADSNQVESILTKETEKNKYGI